MIFFDIKLAGVVSFFSIAAINLVFPKPAFSAISCETGTISRYSNGNLAFCVLARDTRVTVSNAGIGRISFPCKAKNYIVFTEKSQFKRCKIYRDIKIRQGNSTQSCSKDSIVLVSPSSDGKNLSIRCKRY